jgi:hypothetical protein
MLPKAQLQGVGFTLAAQNTFLVCSGSRSGIQYDGKNSVHHVADWNRSSGLLATEY